MPADRNVLVVNDGSTDGMDAGLNELGRQQSLRVLLSAPLDWSSPVTITQDESTLTVEYRGYDRSNASRKSVCRPDGTVTAMASSVDPQGRTSLASHARRCHLDALRSMANEDRNY